MNEPIDVIVPWVNPNDKNWIKEFEYWKELETGNKDKCRYRDWGFLKYVFRSIEENIPWVRYVFLVLASESQIPDWLNTECPKLKIVYHKDYIPTKYLPTFNSNIIELFYSNIEELSENFILLNDDTFFCKYLNKEFFFRDGKPVSRKGYKGLSNCAWDITLKNSRNITNKLLGLNDVHLYDTDHLPVGYIKSLQQYVLTKIDLSFMTNKFRKSTDITHIMFHDLQCKMNKNYFVSEVRGKCFGMTSNKHNNLDCYMCCFNENEHSTINGIKTAIEDLANKFRNKSSFEI